MASPQIEDGFTGFANELLEALYNIDLNKHEGRIVLFIIRMTYGFKRKKDAISLSQFEHGMSSKDKSIIVKGTNLYHREICRNINRLVERNIVIKNTEGYITTYGIQKDYSKWLPYPKTPSDNPSSGNLPTGNIGLIPPLGSDISSTGKISTDNIPTGKISTDKPSTEGVAIPPLGSDNPSTETSDNPSTETSGNPSTYQIKEIKEIKNTKESIPNKPTFIIPLLGEFQNIKLSQEEYDKLIKRFGEVITKEKIEILSSGIASKGYKYKSHYATILSWDRKDKMDNRDNGHKSFGRFKTQPIATQKDLEKEWV
jgi:phage replication O-like protein O